MYITHDYTWAKTGVPNVLMPSGDPEYFGSSEKS